MAEERTIPIVDAGAARDGDGADLAAAAEAALEGFGKFGLVYVANHGVDADNVRALYDEFATFTSRPEAEKRTLCRSDLWYQRGWTPPNTEQAVVAGGQPDFKECYFAAPVATDPECAQRWPELYPDNVWPAGAEEFRERYMKLGEQLHRAGSALLRACAVALDLPPDALSKLAEGGPHVCRLLRYLPLTAEQAESDVLWGEEHTDFNLLTLLPGGQFRDPNGAPCDRPDDGSGLYLRARPDDEHPRGRKVRGVAPPGCIVAQVGQQLEILTGGRLLATPHVITAPDTPGYTRMSAAHFVHVHSRTVLEPLADASSAEAIDAYAPPVLAGTYSIKTLVDIGLAPKEALDNLGYRHYGRLAGIRAEEADG